MKKRISLLCALVLALSVAIGSMTAFAAILTKTNYDVIAGSSFELELPIGYTANGLKYSVLNSSVVTCTNGSAIIKTSANFMPGWSDIADIEVRYNLNINSSSDMILGNIRVVTRNPVFNPNAPYPGYYNPYYPNGNYPIYPSDYPYYPTYYNNYYPNNYPLAYYNQNNTVRESREPIVAVGQGKDRSSLANEIKNSASLTIDGVMSEFDLFITGSHFAINPKSSAGGMAKIKMNAGQLSRMNRYEIDAIRLNCPDTYVTLIVGAKMDQATNYNTFSIDTVSRDMQAEFAEKLELIGKPVEITANSKQAGMGLEFHIGVKEKLSKSQLMLVNEKGDEIDLSTAKLFRNKAEDNSGNVQYGYRLLVENLPGGCYALAYR